MEKKWFILHVYSGYENFVVKELKQKIERNNLTEFFGEMVIPSEDVMEMKATGARKSKRKFFPGYIMIHMSMNDEVWYTVRNTPRVLGFVGSTGDKPLPITDAEAGNILNRMKSDENKPKPKVIFDVGEIVRIINGPFNDFTGVIEEVLYDKNKLKVSVSIFGRATPVELDFFQVEKS